MRNFVPVLLTAVLLLFVSTHAFGADNLNQTANKVEDDFSVIYSGTLTPGAAGGDGNFASQWFRIDFIDIANNPGELQIYCSKTDSTEDVNFSIQFSNSESDTSFAALATDTDLDSVSVSVIFDTVGVAMGKKSYGAKYARIYGDGQTDSPTIMNVYWFVYFNKPAVHANRRLASVGDTTSP